MPNSCIFDDDHSVLARYYIKKKIWYTIMVQIRAWQRFNKCKPNTGLFKLDSCWMGLLAFCNYTKNEWQEKVHQISISKETNMLQLKSTDVISYHVSYLKSLLAWHLNERHFTFWLSGCCYASFFCFSKPQQFEKGTKRVSWKFKACVKSTAEGLFSFIS